MVKAYSIIRKECIMSTVKENSGQEKLLHEWFEIINSKLSRSQQIGIRSLGHIVNIMSKNGHFILERKVMGSEIYYRFGISGTQKKD